LAGFQVTLIGRFWVIPEVLVGIRSPKTLRLHFRDELDRGLAEVKGKIGKTLIEMGTSGEHPAVTIFLAKTRLGMRERQPFDARPMMPPPAFVVTCDQGAQLHDQA